MKLLLDTHALLWATLDPDALSRAAADAIADDGNIVLVSAASAWEIATKVRIGKLPGAERLERDFLQVMDDAGYQLLPIAVETALRAGRLRGEHRDPFDRILAAEALEADMPMSAPTANLTSS